MAATSLKFKTTPASLETARPTLLKDSRLSSVRNNGGGETSVVREKKTCRRTKIAQRTPVDRDFTKPIHGVRHTHVSGTKSESYEPPAKMWQPNAEISARNTVPEYASSLLFAV